MRYAGFAAVLALAACATAPDPAQSVYVLQGALTTAIKAATAYANLPRCATVTGTAIACSDPSLLKDIDDAADEAASMITSAEAVVTDPSASTAAKSSALANATAAVTALTKLTGTTS